MAFMQEMLRFSFKQSLHILVFIVLQKGIFPRNTEVLAEAKSTQRSKNIVRHKYEKIHMKDKLINFHIQLTDNVDTTNRPTF